MDYEISVFAFTFSILMSLKSGLRDTVHSEGREMPMRMPHKAIKVVVEPLQKFELRKFTEKSRMLLEWKSVPLLLSNSFEILETKDMSAVRHSLSVNRLFSRCIVAGANFISIEMASERSVRETNMRRNRFKEMSSNSTDSVNDENTLEQEDEANCGQALLKKNFLFKGQSFLEKFMELLRV